MLQTNEDRYDCLLILRLIDIHTVPVMDGEQFLADVCYRVSVPVLYQEIHLKYISLDLPAEPIDIDYVLYDMEQLIPCNGFPQGQ